MGEHNVILVRPQTFQNYILLDIILTCLEAIAELFVSDIKRTKHTFLFRLKIQIYLLIFALKLASLMISPGYTTTQLGLDMLRKCLLIYSLNKLSL
jgi:hypothetical protein